MKAITSAEMRAIEIQVERLGTPPGSLMEQAGREIALAIMGTFSEKSDLKVVILAGPGNNGGDGLVAGRILAAKGVTVNTFVLLPRKQPPDKVRDKVIESNLKVEKAFGGEALMHIRSALKEADLVIDAVLGTGSNKPLSEWLATVFSIVEKMDKFVFAVDVPTGVDVDSGRLDPNTLTADVTFALGFPKVGTLTFPGKKAVGQLKTLDIGLPEGLDENIKTELLDEDLAYSLLPDRPEDSHKGTFGSLLIVAGCVTYSGAALLAAAAAVRSGVGLVHLAIPRSIYRAVAGRVPEVICHPLPEKRWGELDSSAATRLVLGIIENFTALLVGPGLGQSAETGKFVRTLLFSGITLPTVLDADCLNILSETYLWQNKVIIPGVLTPHPGELSRLTGTSIQNIQANRLNMCISAAKQLGKTIVLKGAGSIVAATDGRIRISTCINSGLAKGGSGDVLSGLMAGLLAQMPDRVFDAASLAVYLHGTAGDKATQKFGRFAMTPSDTVQYLHTAFARIEDK